MEKDDELKGEGIEIDASINLIEFNLVDMTKEEISKISLSLGLAKDELYNMSQGIFNEISKQEGASMFDVEIPIDAPEGVKQELKSVRKSKESIKDNIGALFNLKPSKDELEFREKRKD